MAIQWKDHCEGSDGKFYKSTAFVEGTKLHVARGGMAWYVQMNEIGPPRDLEAVELAAAKVEAIAFAKAKLRAALDELEKA